MNELTERTAKILDSSIAVNEQLIQIWKSQRKTNTLLTVSVVVLGYLSMAAYKREKALRNKISELETKGE